MISITTILGSSWFLVSSTKFLQYEGIQRNRLEWGDISNSTFIYDFTIFASFGSEDAYQYWFPLNNSQIRITIDKLPDINSSMDAEWYIENIANSDKVFVNRLDGSEIKFSLRTVLERVVSFLIFPIGDWDFFDNHFGKKVELKVPNGEYPRYYEFLGKSYGGAIYSFSRWWLQQESGTGTYNSFTNGNVEKNSGIPVYISHHWLFYHPNGFEYTIVLNQHLTNSRDS